MDQSAVENQAGSPPKRSKGQGVSDATAYFLALVVAIVFVLILVMGFRATLNSKGGSSSYRDPNYSKWDNMGPQHRN